MSIEETEQEFGRRFIDQDGFKISEAMKCIDRARESLPLELQQIALTFLESLRRTEKVGGLPYTLTWMGRVDVTYQVIAQRATIKALDRLDPFADNLDAEVPKLRDQLAREEFLRFCNSENAHQEWRAETFAALRRNASLTAPQLELLSVSQDLILQCTVSVWAAMETFVADFVRTLINIEPNRALKLLADEDCKKRIGKVKWSLEQLLEQGLDLSSRVGDLVLSENDLSDLNSIRVVLLALFDRHSQLTKALDDKAIYLLGKSRHLLVHRAGRVDAKFERETASRWKVGDLLSISADELCTYAQASATIVSKTINAYLATLNPHTNKLT